MYHITHKTTNKLFQRFARLTANIFARYVHNSDSQRNEIDALDTFTTQLLRRKTDRWEHIRVKKKMNNTKPCSTVLQQTSLSKEDYILDISNFIEDELNDLIIKAENEDNYKLLDYIFTQCVKYEKCPTGAALQKLLSFFAQSGDKDSIKRFQILAEKINPEQYELNAKFLHYLAEAIWTRGNVQESLKLFEEVYENYVFLRRKIKLMIKFMIVNVISDHSEATLVVIINFTEDIATKYDDYFPLACIWQACFISEWYSDQCKAAEILERHEKLCHHISNRIHFVVNTALKSHRTEVVHRLFELLLKYDMKIHYNFILQSLFNYRCKCVNKYVEIITKLMFIYR